MPDPDNSDDCMKVTGNAKCFEHLHTDELELFNNKKKQLTYLKGENLFKQGAFAPYVLFVVEGIVLLYLQTGRGKRVNIRIAKPGDYLAFSTAFGENVYTHSAMALRDSVICMIEKNALSRLLINNPEFAMGITSSNCRREAHLLELIRNISFKQMRGKLASALIYLASEEFAGYDLLRYLSRQDIADFATISSESAIKFLKEFEKEGIVALKGKSIVILDQERLEDIYRRG